VCETGNNPSRLVDRLVTAGLVQRQPHHDDRRHVTLSLTEPGRRLAEDIMAVEDKLYRMIDDVTDEMPLPETLTLLRKLAGVFPAGQALSRRAATGHGGAHE
jgi:DNA-binding MarR family transcriptional regulator